MAALLGLAALPVAAQQQETQQQGAQVVVPQAGDGTPSAAAGAPILTIDQDALYRGSAWGQRAEADLAARSRALAAENDRIAAGLEAEDDALTELRKTLPADEFRSRADAFDRKVQQTRRERDEASRRLMEDAEQDRSAFFNAALPVFTDVMAERGALVILERRSVFLAAQAVDITEMMTARLDAAIGAGPDDAGETGDAAAPGGAADGGQPGDAGGEAAGPPDAVQGEGGPDGGRPEGAAPDAQAPDAQAPAAQP